MGTIPVFPFSTLETPVGMSFNVITCIIHIHSLLLYVILTIQNNSFKIIFLGDLSVSPHKELLPLPVAQDTTQMYIVIGVSGGSIVAFAASIGGFVVILRRRRCRRNAATRASYTRVATVTCPTNLDMVSVLGFLLPSFN